MKLKQRRSSPSRGATMVCACSLLVLYIAVICYGIHAHYTHAGGAAVLGAVIGYFLLGVATAVFASYLEKDEKYVKNSRDGGGKEAVTCLAPLLGFLLLIDMLRHLPQQKKA